MFHRAGRSTLASVKRDTNQTTKEEPTMIKPTIRYARYVLAALATLGFGVMLN